MSTYLYTGPTTGITFRGSKGAKVEKMLFPGKEVELPDCAEVATLVALKRLKLVATPAAAAETPAAPKTPATEPAAAATAAASEVPIDTGATATTARKGA